jgi:hypothetical protein
MDMDLPKLVKVYIEFNRIGEIDTLEEKYKAEITVEAKWLHEGFIDEYDSKKYWNPKLSIENLAESTREQVSYKLKKDSNNSTTKITEIQRIKGIFWERLELADFPNDIQDLSITVVTELKSDEIKLIWNPNKTSFINNKHTFFDQQKWYLFKMVKTSSMASYDIGSTSTINDIPSNFLEKTSKSLHPPKVVASCFCHRRPGYFIFNAYFLIFLITASALVIFSLDPKSLSNRLSPTFSVLLISMNSF